jgi:RNA polymerase sigma-70 factor (ECF subfamily)
LISGGYGEASEMSSTAASLSLAQSKDGKATPRNKSGGEVGFHVTAESGRAAWSSPVDKFLAESEYKAFKIALYALRDEQAALDVVQDAMFKLVQKYSNKPESEWPALFFTILNNRITDVRRWRKLHEAAGRTISLFRSREGGEEDLIESGLGADKNPPQNQPETAVLAKQLRNEIDKALEYLSDRQRQVFILREWQGMSVRDTASVLGCSEGSVKQHHFRAMRSLREKLAGVWNHE